MAENLYEFWLFYLLFALVLRVKNSSLIPPFSLNREGGCLKGGVARCVRVATPTLQSPACRTGLRITRGWPLVLAGGQKWWKLRQWRPSRTRTRSPGLAVWGRGWRCFSRTSTMRKTSSRALSLSSSLPSARRPLWWWEGMAGFSWKTLFSWSSRFQLPTGSVAERHVVHLCCPCCMCVCSSLSRFL